MDKIRIVKCEPGKKAEIVDVDRNLETYQKIVGGFIELIYPFDDDVALVCNEEGKIYGADFNRVLFNEEGQVADFIVGPFFIVGCSSISFKSLTKEQAEKYKALYLYPESLYNIGGKTVRVVHDMD